MTNSISPIKEKQRHIILDALRGFALVGICLANFPEFSLYTFLDNSITEAMPTAGIDRVVKYLQYIFIDGKFYSIFSILFGIGFSIILSNAQSNGRNGLSFFYRRMTVLFLFGLIHLIFLWAGDILILYAFVGFFLPLFRNMSNRKLLLLTVILLVFPVFIDACISLFNWQLSAPVIHATTYFHNRFGITPENFPIWLVEKNSYLDVLKFNVAGSFIRMQEFIEGNRIFKVLGLFLFGLYIGRNKLYTNLCEKKDSLKKVCLYSFLIGFPITLLYAYSAMNGHLGSQVLHSILYNFSVFPLSLAYISVFSLIYTNNENREFFRILSFPGRIALTNYIMQSVFGIIIFYGIGFGLGAKTGLIYVELIAFGVFITQVFYSWIWLNKFQFGPLEWCWRMLAYGKKMKLKKS